MSDRYVIVVPKPSATVPQRVMMALEVSHVLGPFDSLEAAVAYLNAAQLPLRSPGAPVTENSVGRPEPGMFCGTKRLLPPGEPPSLAASAATTKYHGLNDDIAVLYERGVKYVVIGDACIFGAGSTATEAWQDALLRYTAAELGDAQCYDARPGGPMINDWSTRD